MPHAIQVAVIGAGATGSAAALYLARRGAAVTLYDQFAFGHDRGASHGATRLFRTAYFEHPDYVPILQRALARWKIFEQEAGEKLFFQTGVLEAGPVEGFLLKGLREAAERHRLRVEYLDGPALRRRYPQFTFPEGYMAVFEHEAGFVLADRTVAQQIRMAQAHGAA
ncbi:MAG: FAD-dependent oxidoreductase, partial [Gammaproteobacteria bacterium]